MSNDGIALFPALADLVANPSIAIGVDDEISTRGEARIFTKGKSETC